MCIFFNIKKTMYYEEHFMQQLAYSLQNIRVMKIQEGRTVSYKRRLERHDNCKQR